jgi:hypothetical protein
VKELNPPQVKKKGGTIAKEFGPVEMESPHFFV